jgi:hypothetical protein
MNEFRRFLASVGFGVCPLPGWLAILCLAFGGAGIFWFLCTWLFVAFFGFLLGLAVLPALENGGILGRTG